MYWVAYLIQLPPQQTEAMTKWNDHGGSPLFQLLKNDIRMTLSMAYTALLATQEGKKDRRRSATLDCTMLR